MLVAAAGYGKTTLAEQWVQRDGRRGTWYTARRSSTDVAGLAMGLARAAAELVPGCDARLRAHLRAVPNPGEHVDVLAELLGEELSEWPREDWLVFDEYQELAEAPDGERFVEELLAVCPLQLLIASRLRPAWVTGRNILYGDVLELNQTVLAMDNLEAGELLGEKSSTSAAGLVALAHGWPAVIALASVSSAEIESDDDVPDSLYRFFAEEVFDALGADVRTGLATLAVAPLLDRELAAELIGEQAAEVVCAAALDVGILVERGPHLELHPLARSFLEDRTPTAAGSAATAAASTCVVHYKARRDWDAAFDVIARRGLVDDLESLLRDALDDLLDAARLPTIETWCDLAAQSGYDRPLFSIAHAEVALRRGRHAEAQAFAEVAASADDPHWAFRALSVAGRAAHLASREEEALELFRRAENAADSETERRDALWGQLLCAVELELPDTGHTLQALRADVALTDPREVVRAAAYELAHQLKFGGTLDLTNAELAVELVSSVTDPLIRTSFQNAYSHVLALSARYAEAIDVLDALLRETRNYRFDFAIPYVLTSAAMATAGMRKWERSNALIEEAVSAARLTRNAHAEQVCYAVQVRVLAQEGQHRTALALEVPPLNRAIGAIRAEVLSSRALILATRGRLDEASSLVDKIHGSTSAVEPTVLVAAVEAVAGLMRGDAEGVRLVIRLEELAFGTGALDLLVTAYRTSPELLAVLLRASRDPERIGRFIRNIGDEDLARAVGRPLILSEDDQRQRLSPRERDVYELLRQGLSNRQIAETLFISEGTAKLHTHHIFNKLGTRSRTALVIQAALEGVNQATSATGSSDNDAVS